MIRARTCQPFAPRYAHSALPAGSLPIDLIVRIGEQSWTVSVAGRAGN